MAEIAGSNTLPNTVKKIFNRLSSITPINNILGMDYDASQVPAEWYGWLHYKTDLLPSEDPSRPKYKWMMDHTENASGTPDQYMPYSTTKPKIEAWVPPARQ